MSDPPTRGVRSRGSGAWSRDDAMLALAIGALAFLPATHVLSVVAAPVAWVWSWRDRRRCAREGVPQTERAAWAGRVGAGTVLAGVLVALGTWFASRGRGRFGDHPLGTVFAMIGFGVLVGFGVQRLAHGLRRRRRGKRP